MLIKLNDEFEIESDDRCIWMNRWKTTKKGKNVGARYKTVGYCGYHRTLPALLESFAEYRVRGLDVTEWKEVCDEIERLRDEIQVMCDGIRDIRGENVKSE